MAQRAWAAQWRRLAAEQQAADAAASDALPPLPPDAARRLAQQRRATAQLQAQLAKHLEAASALSTAAAAQLSPHSVQQQLARRRQQCEAAAAQLRAAYERQLAETQNEEQQLAAEYEAAMQSVQQLLQGAPATSATEAASIACGRSSGTSRRHSTTAAAGSAPAAPGEGGLPPEVAACDAFLQRHGPTGACVWGGRGALWFGVLCMATRASVCEHHTHCCCSFPAPTPCCSFSIPKHTGGWHSDDHAEFERILAACRGNYAHCVQLAAAELGLLHSQEDVARHARWVHPFGPQWMVTLLRGVSKSVQTATAT